jgi:para-nitrobenzyl esterase
MEKDKVRVSCEQGLLNGTEEGKALAFYNIPYGSNKGRFKSVGEPQTWSGVRDATKPGPVFPQLPSRLSAVMGTKKEELNQSEDAFSLNVWTKDKNKKRPVLFWIHGGGWVTGGGSLPWYNGNAIASNGDIVVVTVNYRIGALGNLSLPGISENNLALKDLIAALKWIKINIAEFGGDPEQITVAGQSAGAWYSVALMACEEVKGLFNHTALFSFPGGVKAVSTTDSTQMADLLLQSLGISKDDENKILDVSVPEILSSQGKVSEEMQRRKNEMMPPTFVPVIDSVLLKGDIISEAVKISGGRVKVLAGFTAEETTAFLHQSPISNKSSYREIVDLSTNSTFVFPSYELMDNLNDAGSDTYLFKLNYPSVNPSLLATHCFDLPFIFGNFEKWKNSPMLEGANLDEAKLLSKHIQNYFLSFIKKGTPNYKGGIEWPGYERKSRNVLLLDKKIELDAISIPILPRLKIFVWKKFSKVKSFSYALSTKKR